MKKLIVFAIAIFGFTAVSFGQTGTTNTVAATATAKIIQKLTLSQNTGLNFGTVGAKSVETTAIVDASLAGTRSGTADLIATGVGSAGKFTVVGEPSTNFSITFPTGATPLTAVGSSGGVAMSIAGASWVSSVGTTAVSTGTGTKEFYVGATLTVGASQLSDTYNGTYDVTVHYE